MNKKTLFFILVGVVSLGIMVSSCKKTIINNYYCDCDKDSCTTNPPPPDTCKDLKPIWKGYYSALGGLSTSVGDSAFIGGGIARLISKNSPYGYFWTNIGVAIPPCRTYSADSLKMEALVRNPLSEGSIEELDITIMIGGTNDTAQVTYIGRAHRQEFTSIGIIGDPARTQSNLPELVQLFQDWTTIALEVKNGVLYAYRAGTLMKSYSIAGLNLGKLNSLAFTFKGTASVDWIKVTDNSGNLKIREEFNTDKTSTVEFF